MLMMLFKFGSTIIAADILHQVGEKKFFKKIVSRAIQKVQISCGIFQGQATTKKSYLHNSKSYFTSKCLTRDEILLAFLKHFHFSSK